jgi:hypothetical protein
MDAHEQLVLVMNSDTSISQIVLVHFVESDLSGSVHQGKSSGKKYCLRFALMCNFAFDSKVLEIVLANLNSYP